MTLLLWICGLAVLALGFGLVMLFVLALMGLADAIEAWVRGDE